MTWYVTIRSDARYSKYADTASLVEFLNTMPSLRQTAPDAFSASDGQPSVEVILAECCTDGNYNCDGTFNPKLNVVELICSDSHDPVWYNALATQIADFLGWSAFEDHEIRQICPSDRRHSEQVKD